MDRIAIRRALVSVYDKTGLAELGRALADAGVEVVSTGGSYRLLADAGVPDALYRATQEEFSEADLVKLTVAVGIINIWNRLCVAFHTLHPVR